MAFWRVIILAFAASIFVEAKYYQHQKRETTPNICDPTYSNATSVQCYCVVDSHYSEIDIFRRAECHLTKNDVLPDDKIWDNFEKLKNATKLTLSNTRGNALTYVPTKAINHMHALFKLDIKYGNIEKIGPFAFANLTVIEEIKLTDNQIKTLAVDAFAHHRDLTIIGLDSNNIVEINRNVFVDLPSLDKLFLTNNKITTIHDKAFVHLTNLRELEIDRNNIFSLNSETFSGLKKLQKLDLSSNSLEVIGDNTFLPLTNLETLNLDGNKIQMMDEKAFHGLGKLSALSLAHNNLTNIENVKIFESLKSLKLLSFKSNQLVELKTEVMAPILGNFYGNSSSLDVEDNNFPCDCRLEWFLSLMNKTQNGHLKLALENLKCNPSDNLKELWTKSTEADKNAASAAEDVDPSQNLNADYEYYDDAQLNGKLFYLDIRELANCTKSSGTVEVTKPEIEVTTKLTTKAVTTSHTTPKSVATTTHMISTKPANIQSTQATKEIAKKPNTDNETKNKEATTTVKLATVSAKPLEHSSGLFDHDMASDEARPGTIKAHRSVQDEAPNDKINNAHANFSSILVVAIMLCFRFCF